MSATDGRRFSFGLQSYSGLYLWATFIIVFGVWKPDLFLTSATLHSVAAAQAVSAMLALGLLIPLTAGVYDLSVGAVTNVSAVLVVTLQTVHGVSMGPAILAAIATSAAIGTASGFIVVKLKVNSFVATLGMATVVAAIQTIISGGTQPFPPSGSAWTSFTQQTVLGFQIIVLYMLVLAFVVWWVLDHTPVGRYLYAIGGSSEAARLTGISVGRWTWLSLIASSTIAGTAGIFYASLSGPSLTFGQALLLPAFAAVFLGSTQLRPGRFNVWGTLLAVYVLATGVQGLQFVTGVQWLNDMFNGVALLAAVSFAVWRQGAKGRRRERATATDTQAEHPVDADVKQPVGS
ncbi:MULTISPECIES: ABC transporter permease [Protofrankia]|uniref:ABC transporter permease n=1 Tax=Protofrankia coriariae TaxID=1562887 RepID=A0ABR5F5L3_9ACTN|nr:MULTISPECIES: ABC transporter permease [Protofrankia]KLL11974.1 ABC transporter permease [Protofrankia coriariae]ONH36868.1 ABC transporter permease [Protofrankia sp. BMG5.30]